MYPAKFKGECFTKKSVICFITFSPLFPGVSHIFILYFVEHLMTLRARGGDLSFRVYGARTKKQAENAIDPITFVSAFHSRQPAQTANETLSPHWRNKWTLFLFFYVSRTGDVNRIFYKVPSAGDQQKLSELQHRWVVFF